MGGAAVRSIERQVEEFTEKMTAKFNKVVDSVDVVRQGMVKLATAIQTNLFGIKSNMDTMSSAVENLDVYNQIYGRMILKLIERVVQTEYMLRVDYSSLSQFNAYDRELVRTEAETLFSDLFESTKKDILDERQAYIEKMRKQAEEEEAKKEQSIAEEALHDAGKSSAFSPEPEGDVEYPIGAEIFGG